MTEDNELEYRPEKPISENFIPQVGDWVFFYPMGDASAKPHPAIVTLENGVQRTLSLTIFYSGGNIGHTQATKHMGQEKVTLKDRERNGGWAWNRTFKAKPVVKPEPALAAK